MKSNVKSHVVEMNATSHVAMARSRFVMESHFNRGGM